MVHREKKAGVSPQAKPEMFKGVDLQRLKKKGVESGALLSYVPATASRPPTEFSHPFLFTAHRKIALHTHIL